MEKGFSAGAYDAGFVAVDWKSVSSLANGHDAGFTNVCSSVIMHQQAYCGNRYLYIQATKTYWL